MMRGWLRPETSAALAVALVALVPAIAAPAFYTPGNLRDLLMANCPS